MSLNRQSLIDMAYLRNLSRGQDIPLGRYDALEPQARIILARKISEDKDDRVRNQLRTDFSVTVTAGVGSFAAHLTSTEPMLDHTLDKAVVTSGDSPYPWQYLEDYSLITLERPPLGLIHFAVKGTNIYPTDTQGVINSLDTTATVHASYVPLATTISGDPDLEEMAIEILANLAVLGQAQQ